MALLPRSPTSRPSAPLGRSVAVVALVLGVALVLSSAPHVLAAAASTPVCTNLCLDCRDYKGTSYCAQCIDARYVPDWNTKQCAVRPSTIKCNVAHCDICVINAPQYCYMCSNDYRQESEDLLCYALPTTTTTTTTPAPTTTTTSTTPAPVPEDKTTTTTTTTTTTSTTTTTTTTTTTALCEVLWCAQCDYTNGSRCMTCYDGFTWKKSEKCEPIQSCYVSGCAECDPEDSSVCRSCRAGYELVSPSECQNKALKNGAAGPRPQSIPVVAVSALLLLLLLLTRAW